MSHADVLSEHPGGDLHPKLFLGVVFRSPCFERASHAAFMTGPVTKLMESRGVVFVRCVKIVFGWKVDLIPRDAVEGVIRLIMLDDSPRSGQVLLRFFERFPVMMRRGYFEGRQTLDIQRVEYLMAPGYSLRPGHIFGIAFLIRDGPAVFIQLVFRLPREVIPDGNGSAALPDRVASLLVLSRRHPARIARGEHSQPQAVDALVRDAGNGIEGCKPGYRRPGLLSGGCAVLRMAMTLAANSS